MHLPKWRQRIILLVTVILQGNIPEYYPARDMLSINEISNTANEYEWGLIKYVYLCSKSLLDIVQITL